jgi:hypothetical protein
MDITMDNERKSKIIEELSSNRENLYELLNSNITDRKSLEKFKVTDDDFKNRRSNMTLAVELTKTKSELINAELNIRKSIDSSIKTEYELLSKFEKDSANKKEANIDIAALAAQILKYRSNEEHTNKG